MSVEKADAAPRCDASILEARALAVGYEGVALISGIDLSVAAGQVVTLIGPNGAGKSTILKTLAGQLPPLGGAVRLLGRDLAEVPLRERARSLSVLLTDRLHTELMTCEEVVETGRHPHTGRLGILDGEDHGQVREAMELAGVWELRDRDFMRLSDGQRQRILLARAICQEPRLLVLDEPTSYLDIRYQIELLELLRLLVRTREVGVVMSLHELPLAGLVSDWLVCVREGAVYAQGTPDEVLVPEVIDGLFGLRPGTFDPGTGAVTLPGTADERGKGVPDATAR